MVPTRAAVLLLMVLVLAACADPSTVGSPPPDAEPEPPVEQPVELPAEPDALVLRVEDVGGFTTPETAITRLPRYSVYADGRLITEGPVPAIYPGPALPNVQVQELDPATVRDLAERALAAGVAETGDLGSPNVADVPATRFTVTTADGTHVREVEALSVPGLGGEQPEAGLTDQQVAARARLRELVDAIDALGQQLPAPDSYVPASVAAIVRPWSAPEEDVTAGLPPAPVPWPGPPLPGEPVGGLLELSCVTATGDQAVAVLAAARDANGLTPWATPDGALWSVTFRPLLPDESGCADLLG